MFADFEAVGARLLYDQWCYSFSGRSLDIEQIKHEISGFVDEDGAVVENIEEKK